MIIQPLAYKEGWFVGTVNYNGHKFMAYGKSNLEVLQRLFVELTF